jgi:hypothetical protein
VTTTFRPGGHRFPAAVDALREQLDRYMHQCMMVATYEPYLNVCRRLAEHSPCGRGCSKESARELGRGGGRECRQARARRYYTTGCRRVRQILPRPHPADLDDDEQGEAVQARRSLCPRGLPRARPYPYQGITTEDAIASLQSLFATGVDAAEVACVVLEPVQGEGGFIPMPTTSWLG